MLSKTITFGSFYANYFGHSVSGTDISFVPLHLEKIREKYSLFGKICKTLRWKSIKCQMVLVESHKKTNEQTGDMSNSFRKFSLMLIS